MIGLYLKFCGARLIRTMIKLSLRRRKVFGGWGGVGEVGWGGWSESKFSVISGPNLLEFELGLNLGPSLIICMDAIYHDTPVQEHYIMYIIYKILNFFVSFDE